MLILASRFFLDWVSGGLVCPALATLPNPRTVSGGHSCRADEIVRKFRQTRGLLTKSPPAETTSSLELLRKLHTEFKNLPLPDGATSYHWCVSEAMRHDIEALETAKDPARMSSHQAAALSYWRHTALAARVPLSS